MRIIAGSYGFDFDAEALWLGTFDLTTPTSRGQYRAYVGMPRVMDFFDNQDIKAAIFVPG